MFRVRSRTKALSVRHPMFVVQTITGHSHALYRRRTASDGFRLLDADELPAPRTAQCPELSKGRAHATGSLPANEGGAAGTDTFFRRG